LVVLGVTTILRAARERGWTIHSHTHAHESTAQPHTHIHVHLEEEHIHRHRMFKLGKRPFVVGMVHGVAGSAALTVAVMAKITSVWLGLVFISVFGIGSIGGMLLMSGVIGLPFALTARRFSILHGGIKLLAGLFSILFGLALGWSLLQEISRINS